MSTFCPIRVYSVAEMYAVAAPTPGVTVVRWSMVATRPGSASARVYVLPAPLVPYMSTEAILVPVPVPLLVPEKVPSGEPSHVSPCPAPPPPDRRGCVVDADADADTHPPASATWQLGVGPLARPPPGSDLPSACVCSNLPRRGEDKEKRKQRGRECEGTGTDVPKVYDFAGMGGCPSISSRVPLAPSGSRAGGVGDGNAGITRTHGASVRRNLLSAQLSWVGRPRPAGDVRVRVWARHQGREKETGERAYRTQTWNFGQVPIGAGEVSAVSTEVS